MVPQCQAKPRTVAFPRPYHPTYLPRSQSSILTAAANTQAHYEYSLGSLTLSKYLTNGYPRPHFRRYPPRPVHQYHKSTRKLFPKVLPLPCSFLATTLLRCRRCLSPQKNTLRSSQNRRICACQNGRRAGEWDTTWAHHKSKCYENA